jgi:hypothetical protein
MSFPRLRLALLAAACLATFAHAQVTPPPRPPGSNLVRVEPGMNEDERKRHVRAHHHKMHHKKDYTRDDSVHGHETERTAGPASSGAMGSNASAGAVPGGAGTGPAREKTDKGASSYFYGSDKKK